MSTLKTNSITDVSGKPLVNNSGGIIQVVQSVKTDKWTSASNGTNFYAVSGMSATITPTSASSKILVGMQICCSSGYWEIQGRIYRNGSLLTGAIGNAASNRTRCTFSVNEYPGQGSVGYGMYVVPVQYLDSPASTSAQTYQLYLNGYSSFTIAVNGNGYSDTDNADYYGRGISTVTLMEVVG